MKSVVWGDTLKHEYESLFASCVVTKDVICIVDGIVARMVRSKIRYEAIAKAANPTMPWWFVACLHQMECSGRFDCHIHNGDPLKAKTVHVPAGRPAGFPPWTFEQSAHDALVNCMGYGKTTDWSLGHVLYTFEGYNGYGYRQYHSNVLSPYLWAHTNHYKHGKYVADGKWDETEESKQIGIAAILKRLESVGGLQPRPSSFPPV